MRKFRLLTCVCCWILHFTSDTEGLQITDLTVPRSVRNGSDYVILDCQYALLPDDLKPDSGLVVKWFFNSSPLPVYQWIPGKKPQDLGMLKGRLDLDYRVSDHNASMYRALFIKEPTTDLSGDYKCMVSTFWREDFMTKRMIVFAPEKRMILFQSKSDLESVNITCIAQGIYPEPKIALYKDPDRKTKLEIDNSVVEKISRNGAYDIKASAYIEDQNLVTPIIFECELSIPDAKYYSKKSTVFYPGIMGLVSDSNSGGSRAISHAMFVLLFLSSYCKLPERVHPFILAIMIFYLQETKETISKYLFWYLLKT